jgi:hypothetical protein
MFEKLLGGLEADNYVVAMPTGVRSTIAEVPVLSTRPVIVADVCIRIVPGLFETSSDMGDVVIDDARSGGKREGFIVVVFRCLGYVKVKVHDIPPYCGEKIPIVILEF